MRKTFVTLSVALIAISFLSVISFRVGGVVTGENFVTEISDLGFSPRVVDVDADGRIFVGDKNNAIWRSLDSGTTWTQVHQNGSSSYQIQALFVNERGYIFGQHYKSGTGMSALFRLFRSTDNGTTWSLVKDDMKRCGLNKWGESSNGTLYVAYWGEGAVGYLEALIYRSGDHGATWTVFLNLTGQVTHTHAVNVAPNDWVYISTGDGDYANQSIRRYNGTDWEIVTYGQQPTSIWFDDTYAYFGADYSPNKLYRMPYDGTWSQRETIYTQEVFGVNNWIFEGVKFDDFMLFGTERGQLWGSWDGEHWTKIFDTGSANSIFSISKRTPIHFVDNTASKLYRCDVQKDDLIHLFYQQFVEKRGSLTNAQTYIVEQRIHNETNYSDLSRVALRNVQGSIKGLTRINYAPSGNSGFEWGNTTSWTVWGQAGAVTVTNESAEVANGTYGLKVTKHVADTYANTITSPSTTVNKGFLVLLSAYFKGNDTVENAIRISINNATSGAYFTAPYFNITTSWQRHIVTYGFYESTTYSAPSVSIYVKFTFEKKDLETYFDSVLFQVLEIGIEYFESTTEDATVYSEGRTPFSYFDGTLNTINATLTVNGESVSQSGTLTNGTESSATSLSGTLTGAITVEANIAGSQQCILKLTGTRVFYDDSTIIEGQSSSVYYGRYYGTFSPTASTTDLFAVTSMFANITSISYAGGNELGLTIDAPSDLSSVTKVYAPSLGQPRKVDGADDWSYDPSGIVTLTITHQSSRSVSISWGGGASTSYVLTVHVTENMIPLFGATVSVDGQNKTTNLLGDASFVIEYGSYSITAYNGEHSQTKTVDLNRDQTVGFNFNVSTKKDRGIYIFIGLPIGLVILVAVLFFFWRRR